MKNSIASFLQTFFTGLIKPDPRGRRPLPRGVILRFCLPFLRPGQAGGKIYNSTQKQHRPRRCCTGAGDGNRTHVTSLEGWSSTIELHPHEENGAVDETRTRDLHLGKVALYQLSYYRIGTGCGRRDLNSYAFRHRNLNPARLPFRHARETLLWKGTGKW